MRGERQHSETDTEGSVKLRSLFLLHKVGNREPLKKVKQEEMCD